jgi:hypothetical protein
MEVFPVGLANQSSKHQGKRSNWQERSNYTCLTVIKVYVGVWSLQKIKKKVYRS